MSPGNSCANKCQQSTACRDHRAFSKQFTLPRQAAAEAVVIPAETASDLLAASPRRTATDSYGSISAPRVPPAADPARDGRLAAKTGQSVQIDL